jgi:hypothetical protein
MADGRPRRSAEDHFTTEAHRHREKRKQEILKPFFLTSLGGHFGFRAGQACGDARRSIGLLSSKKGVGAPIEQ